jgi:group I intron endonuclease
MINLTFLAKIVKLAVRKYGLDKFAFIVLELFPEIVNIENNKKLLDLEDFYLKSLLPNYNILTEAGSSFGYKHTEIDRIKMKANYSEERRNLIGNLNRGKTFSEETINRMKISALSRSPRSFSEEALSNMKKRSKGIILYNISNNTIFGALWKRKSQVSACIKLPNSGDILKLLIPNYSFKSTIINNILRVIIQKILAKGMDNRGSKSVPNIINYTGTAIINNNVLGVVKEQRVDGSWFLNKQVATCRNLRCTLTGLERDYRIRILSKNLYKKDQRFYSTLPLNETSLNPWFITGFVDGEGCFSFSILENKNSKLDYRVRLFFSIVLHSKDRALMEKIQRSFGVGKISKLGKESIQFRVYSIKELEIIINYFDKYPLITKKWEDYQLFKQAFLLIKNKEHLSIEGLRKIVGIKASLNKGISEELTKYFPEIIIVKRPIVLDQSIRDPAWLAGFVSGEGCFLVDISKSSSSNLGEKVQLKFKISQHNRDEQLLKSFVKYLGCGIYSQTLGYSYGEFIVTKFSDINEKIIPFFEKYPIHGVKQKDFLDFKQVIEIMNRKSHLTLEGLEEIRKIKSGMNRRRTII